MPCSAVTLSLATISAIISVALLSIAFSTDNWLSYEVNRNSIMVSTWLLPIPLSYLENCMIIIIANAITNKNKNVP